jgi:hypothetical protein
MPSRSEGRYTGEQFQRVWRPLPSETKDEIRAKAVWEHMSLSAVMREWWPELWEKVVNGEKS